MKQNLGNLHKTKINERLLTVFKQIITTFQLCVTVVYQLQQEKYQQ